MCIAIVTPVRAREPWASYDRCETCRASELQISVRDWGHGMGENVLRRIAEPFFTTKEPGKGMGLGTFLVRSFAERLGGRVLFMSVPDQGTTVTLELPLQSGKRTAHAAI